MIKKMNYILLLLMTVFMIGCAETEDTATSEGKEQKTEEADEETETQDTSATTDSNETEENAAAEEKPAEKASETTDNQFSGHERIDVDGGDQSGHRESNVVVDIGFGDREYWAFTFVIFRLEAFTLGIKRTTHIRHI